MSDDSADRGPVVEKPGEGVRAVDRALDILLAFRAGDRQLSASELLRRIDLSRPTLYRLLRTLELRGPLPTPSRGRQSRRVKCFPVLPRVTLHPDEKAQRWVLTISSCDRVGLLYSIARVLARHEINLQLAKVTTLGERVEDTFLISGPALQHNREQIEIETELLEAVKD